MIELAWFRTVTRTKKPGRWHVQLHQGSMFTACGLDLSKRGAANGLVPVRHGAEPPEGPACPDCRRIPLERVRFVSPFEWSNERPLSLMTRRCAETRLSGEMILWNWEEQHGSLTEQQRAAGPPRIVEDL